MSEDKLEEHLHYLKLLHQSSSVFQPEIREALKYVVGILELWRDGVK